MVTVSQKVVLLAVVVVCILTAPLFASTSPYITGTSNASLITDGSAYNGWYRYEVEINWSLTKGLSHWDFILKAGCLKPDHLIKFDTPAGYSTSADDPANPYAMGWTGYFERKGDGSIPAVSGPIVKYDSPFFPSDAEAGKVGNGIFSFYSNIVPEYGTHSNALVAKAGSNIVYGDLTGAYPSCSTVVPEPATICLLGLGFLVLVRKRRV